MDLFSTVKIHQDAEPFESASLPKSLEYLKPSIDKIDSLPEYAFEDGKDDGATELIEEALKNRLSALPKSKAESAFLEDYSTLVRWLKHPEMSDSTAWTLVGYFDGLATYGGIEALTGEVQKLDGDDLDRDPDFDPPDAMIDIVTPEGWTRQRAEDEEIQFEKGALFAILRLQSKIERESLERQIDAWHAPPELKLERHISEFNKGQVSGKKLIYLDTGTVKMKSIEYYLAYQDYSLHISLGAEKMGVEFDESDFEESIETLSVTPRKA